MEDSTNIWEALKLLAVGLTTVFAVLLLIIGFGNLLIKGVNKVAPEEEKPAPKAAPTKAAIDPSIQEAIDKAVALAVQNSACNAVDPNVQMAINKAIEQLTAGKSHAVKIQRL